MSASSSIDSGIGTGSGALFVSFATPSGIYGGGGFASAENWTCLNLGLGERLFLERRRLSDVLL